MKFPTEWKIIKFHGSSHHQIKCVQNLCSTSGSSHGPISGMTCGIPLDHSGKIAGWKTSQSTATLDRKNL